MSPADRRFWLAAQRRVASAQPEVQSALMRAFAIIRESFTEAELTRILDAGQLERLFSEALDQSVMDRAFIPYRQRIRHVTDRGFTFATKDLPKGGKIDGAIAVAFDHLSPDVVTAIRTMETKVLQTLQAEVRDTVRAFIENGIRDGKNPRVTARQLRDVIGMSPTQEQNAAKYEAKLRAKGLPASRVERMVATYRKRAVVLNAETNARTATLDAYKEGQRLAWKQASDQGIVDAAQLTKTWKGVMDSRERPEHVAMQNQTVPFDQTYSNGEMNPGDSTYNCRCVSIYRMRAA